MHSQNIPSPFARVVPTSFASIEEAMRIVREEPSHIPCACGAPTCRGIAQNVRRFDAVTVLTNAGMYNG